MPSKSKGLRLQTSDIILGEPGVGKGQAQHQRDSLVEDIKKEFLKYADDEFKNSLQQVQVHQQENKNVLDVEQPAEQPAKFKYVDGVYRLCNMPFTFLIDLPNGSCEGVFLRASRNAACGVVPILEQYNGRRTVLDKDGGNGSFLYSHDPDMKAKLFKTVEIVPEIANNSVFQQIFINLEDVLDQIDIAGNNGTLHRIAYSYADLSGMEKFKAVPCRQVNIVLKRRQIGLFKMFGENHPKCLSFDFGPPNENGVELKENVDGGMPQPVSDEKLNEVFDGDDVKDNDDYPNLQYLSI